MVMCFHYTTQYGVEVGYAVAPAITVPWGRYGVQFFFVISGFVIFLTLSRANSIWDFAANRFSRLYPPYWACIAITFTVMLFNPLRGMNVTGGDALISQESISRRSFALQPCLNTGISSSRACSFIA